MSNAYLGYFLVSLDRPVAKEDAPLVIVLTPSTRGPGPIARPDRYHFPNGPKVSIAAGGTSGEIIVEALNDNVVSSTQYVAVELAVDRSNNALLAPYPFASMPLYDNDFWTWEDISDSPSPTTDSGSIGTLSYNYTMKSEAFATGQQVVCRASTALKATIDDAYLPWWDTTLQVAATQQVSFAIDRNDPSGTIRVVRGGVDEDTKDDAATAIGVTVSPANNPNDRVRTALITFEMNVGVKTKYVKTGSWTGSGSELGGKDVTNDFGTFSTSVTFQGTTESQKGMSRKVTKQYTVSATVTELDDE